MDAEVFAVGPGGRPGENSDSPASGAGLPRMGGTGNEA